MFPEAVFAGTGGISGWAALGAAVWSGLADHGRLAYAAGCGAAGLMAGSFLNVAAWRWPRGASLIWPPSACPACGRRVRARDNVPVLGWLLLRGRCRDCRAPIPARYPAVEAGTGALWAATAWFWAWPLDHGAAVNAGLALAALAFATLLAAAALIDWDTQLIPDETSLGGAAMALGASVAWPALHAAGPSGEWWFPALGARGQSALVCLAGMATGAGAMGLLTWLGTLAFRRRLAELREDDPELDTAVGLGDTKLMLLIGGFLGPAGTLVALFWGVCAGGAAGLAIKWSSGRWPEGPPRGRWAAIRARWETGDALMPLGPWLALGAVLALWGGQDLRGWMAGRLFPWA
jgi:leader peptidase (prepilin peptidase)/N-methyltransferase